MPIESFDGYRRNDDYLRDISRGGVEGARPFSGYGERVTSGAESGVLWPDGVYALPPTSGVQLSISSTSADDTAGGVGVRQLVLIYLDATLTERTAIITLNGTTPVLTPASDIRFVQCMFMLSAGSSGYAVGIISASVGAQVYSQIAAGTRRCASSVRMVPRGKRMVVTTIYAGSSSGSAAAKAIISMATPNFEGVDFTASSVFIPLAAATFQDNSGGISIPCPLAFTEGQVFGLTFSVDKSATIIGSWFGFLEKE